MSRRRPELPGAAGFLVVDKPRGWTSHDVVDAARRWLGTRRIGHLGTLDPLATGVLPLAVREATKLVPFLAAGAKAYTGEIELGAETDTLDAEGRVLRRHARRAAERGCAARRARGLRGRDRAGAADVQRGQARGVPLHRMAREGREVPRAPKKIRIDALTLLAYAPPRARIEVLCSTGTYVRSLAADVGTALGCGAFLASLRRTRSGPFRIEDAAPVDAARGAGAHGAARSEVDPPRQRAGPARGAARGAGRAARAQRQRRDARRAGAASRGAGRRRGPRRRADRGPRDPARPALAAAAGSPLACRARLALPHSARVGGQRSSGPSLCAPAARSRAGAGLTSVPTCRAASIEPRRNRS